MSKIVLLVVGAAWAAVLLPPLLRSRVENRPNSSVVDFRRRLSTLQRTVPARGMAPMRSMARPLVSSPVRPGSRSHHQVAPRLVDVSRPAMSRSSVPRTNAPRVRSHYSAPTPAPAARPMHAHARPTVSSRERLRQRRQTVLFVLVAVTAATAFLALSTANSMMVYAFALAAISLTGYCYKLVQLRRSSEVRPFRESWFRAA